MISFSTWALLYNASSSAMLEQARLSTHDTSGRDTHDMWNK